MSTEAMFRTALAVVIVFFSGAWAQETEQDTAYIPFRVNVNATATAQLSGGEKFEKPVRVGHTDTLLLIADADDISPIIPGKTPKSAVMHNSRGKISLELPQQLYRGADIALYSLNGKQILRSKAEASEAKSISQPNVAMGVYLLSVKGKNGSAFATHLVHSGGGVHINAVFVGETPSYAPILEKALPGIWTITVSAEGYIDTSYNFVPETGRGNTSVQNITLRAESGFEPEMLGIAPGATTAELRFTWYSDSSAANNKTFVRIYDAGGASVGITTKDSTVSGATPGKRYHKIAATGLAPNTQYKYSVSNNGTDWSYKYNYKTPKSDAFKFVAVGDQHQIGVPRTVSGGYGNIDDNAIEMWGIVMSKIAAHSVDFMAGVGDQVDSGGAENAYKNFFAPLPMKNIPYAAVMGNHDLDLYNMNGGNIFNSQPFIYHFNLPNHTAKTMWSSSYGGHIAYGNYWYLYNKVLFVALNTGMIWPYNDKDAAVAAVKRFDTLFTKAITAHKGQYDWLIVQHHESTKSVSAHAEDTAIVNLREAGFEPLMDKHGVDIVLAGHDHAYVRTKPMKNGAATADGKGTIYITLTAGASPKFYPITTSLVKDYVAKSEQNQRRGYALFDVNGKSIVYKAYRVSETNADTVVDSLSLSK